MALKNQPDLNTQLALGWQALTETSNIRRRDNDYRYEFGECIHELMGWRAEHSDPMAF